MRLLSLVPFGCRAGPVDDAPPPADDYHHAGDAAAAARRRRRRRRVARSAAAVGAGEWRPSLGDICEEYDGADAAAKAAAIAAGPARGRKAASWDVARLLPRSRSHEYRHLETSSSMPAFAPTAYLF